MKIFFSACCRVCSRCGMRGLRGEIAAAVLLSSLSAVAQGQSIGPLDSTGASVTVDGSGVGTVSIDLSARQVGSSHTIFVAEGSTGDGSQASPFGDIPEAFELIANQRFRDAIIQVAAGDYSWGDAIDPQIGAFRTFNASITVIGAGSNATRVLQGVNDNYAAVFKEPNRALYVEGIDFVGPGSAGTAANKSVFNARNGSKLTFVDVTFQGASGGDGLFALNFDSIVVFDCKALGNEADGFSYSSTGSRLNVLEVGVEATGNGLNGQASSQGSTMHRNTEILRVNGVYSGNPTNIEDTGLTSWNINLTVENSTVQQNHEGNNFVNMRVRGDKLDVTNGTAYLIGGSYSSGGVVHAHSTTALDTARTPIDSSIFYTQHFDIESHPPSVLFADSGSTISAVEDPPFLSD